MGGALLVVIEDHDRITMMTRLAGLVNSVEIGSSLATWTNGHFQLCDSSFQLSQLN